MGERLDHLRKRLADAGRSLGASALDSPERNDMLAEYGDHAPAAEFPVPTASKPAVPRVIDGPAVEILRRKPERLL